ncbi:VOC family protein [Haloarcula salina]|uniref:VOC family protein n=1 Tax=Haloarcula salina TaxID=1429914 RepID=A0AA41KJP2_9EURY|nr:VOC family protein [Haloarcula salina]MBV0902978.1 VOC family protein [Haloarcula salina]
MTQPPIVPETARIGRTALLVTDLDEMIEFYRTVVGLSVLARSGSAATLGAGGTPLLELTADETAAPRDPAQAGLFHTAFRVPSRTALGAAVERVRDRGQLDGASDHFVSEAVYLSDPEGNGIEIYTDRPRDEWPRTDDGTIDIGTVPLDLEAVVGESDGGETVPPETTVGHVHLEVTDIEAARTFYVDTLGLRLQTASPSALFVAAGDYHHHLGLNAWNRRSQPAGGRGLAWFEWLVADEEALATVRQRLGDAGVTCHQINGGFEISDPDGISIRFRVG